jgi:TonB family protein
MRRTFEVMFTAVLVSVSSAPLVGLGRANFAGDPETSRQTRVKIFQPGADVTSPELLPISMAPVSNDKCHEKLDGKVLFSVIVDASGKPRNLMFIRPLANPLDRLALQFVAKDQFKPGLHSGSPVAVERSLEVEIKACVDAMPDNNGQKTLQLRLRSLPEQKLGTVARPTTEAVLSQSEIPWSKTGDVPTVSGAVPGFTAPYPLNGVEPEYPAGARRQGVCSISLIVDPQGLPEDLHLVKGFDPEWDKSALIAVAKYRFKPATEDGGPIPAKITVEVRFNER